MSEPRTNSVAIHKNVELQSYFFIKARKIYMNGLPKNWIGKNVLVLFGAPIEVLRAKLLDIDSSGVILESSRGQTYIPITSIRAVSIVLNENEPTRIYGEDKVIWK